MRCCPFFLLRFFVCLHCILLDLKDPGKMWRHLFCSFDLTPKWLFNSRQQSQRHCVLMPKKLPKKDQGSSFYFNSHRAEFAIKRDLPNTRLKNIKIWYGTHSRVKSVLYRRNENGPGTSSVTRTHSQEGPRKLKATMRTHDEDMMHALFWYYR